MIVQGRRFGHTEEKTREMGEGFYFPKQLEIQL